MTNRDRLRAAWIDTAKAWDAARSAEWTPDKQMHIADAARACGDARRAYYAEVMAQQFALEGR